MEKHLKCINGQKTNWMKIVVTTNEMLNNEIGRINAQTKWKSFIEVIYFRCFGSYSVVVERIFRWSFFRSKRDAHLYVIASVFLAIKIEFLAGKECETLFYVRCRLKDVCYINKGSLVSFVTLVLFNSRSFQRMYKVNNMLWMKVKRISLCPVVV